MLILSRRRDEIIVIGDDIRITVTDIRGDKVRLGIEAPTDVVVDRLEVWESKRRDRRTADGYEALEPKGA